MDVYTRAVREVKRNPHNGMVRQIITSKARAEEA